MGEERTAVEKEVKKLKDESFIKEIKYPTWLANAVMVKNPAVNGRCV
jgi:hypothetical protein